MYEYQKTKAIVGNGVRAHLRTGLRNNCGSGAAGRSTWKASTEYSTFATEATTTEEIAEELIAAGHTLCTKCFGKVGA